jgi:uncharacterized protein YjbJ (UPF0337 family)
MGTTATKVKGKLKEIEGRVTGDKLRRLEGKVQKTVGKVGSAIKANIRKAKLRTARTKAGRKAAAAKAMP